MYAQDHDTVSSSRPAAAGGVQTPADGATRNVSRASLQTRPGIQRWLIRYWEYIRPVRVTVLVIRMLVVLWMIVLGVILPSSGHAWGWILFPGAAAVFALSIWVFSTAAKGWPVDKA
jgi:hypothetical protein